MAFTNPNAKRSEKSNDSGAFVGNVIFEVVGYAKDGGNKLDVKTISGDLTTLKLYTPKTGPNGAPKLENFGKPDGRDTKSRPAIGAHVRGERCFLNSDGSYASAYVMRADVAKFGKVINGLVSVVAYIPRADGFGDPAISARVVDIEKSRAIEGADGLPDLLNEVYAEASKGEGKSFVYLKIDGTEEDGTPGVRETYRYPAWDKEAGADNWADSVEKCVAGVAEISESGFKISHIEAVPGFSINMVGASLGRVTGEDTRSKAALAALTGPFREHGDNADYKKMLYREGAIAIVPFKRTDENGDKATVKDADGNAVYILTDVTGDMSSTPLQLQHALLTDEKKAEIGVEGTAKDEPNGASADEPDFGDVPIDDDLLF